MPELLREIQTRRAVAERALMCSGLLEQEWSANAETFVPPHRLVRIVRARHLPASGKPHPEHFARLVRLEIEKREANPITRLEHVLTLLELELSAFPVSMVNYLKRYRRLMTPDQVGWLAYSAVSLGAEGAAADELQSLLSERPPPQDKPIDLSVTGPNRPTYSASQQAALARLTEMGGVFFQLPEGSPAKLRLSALLAGPTGTGKTFLALEAASRLGAHAVVSSVGDWIPCGALGEFEPTTYAILSALAERERVVLIIDELDKTGTSVDGTWSRSIWAELWKVLDYRLPVSSFMRSSRGLSLPISETELNRRLPSLWIIGCGTWQEQRTATPLMGFVPREERGAINYAAGAPVELLLRFNPHVIEIPYPSAGETSDIFEKSGLLTAGKSVGLGINPESHDWKQGGMRSLQALWAEIEIRKRKVRT